MKTQSTDCGEALPKVVLRVVKAKISEITVFEKTLGNSVKNKPVDRLAGVRESQAFLS